MWIGERTFERVIFCRERACKCLQVDELAQAVFVSRRPSEKFDAAGIQRFQTVRSGHDMLRDATLLAVGGRYPDFPLDEAVAEASRRSCRSPLPASGRQGGEGQAEGQLGPHTDLLVDVLQRGGAAEIQVGGVEARLYHRLEEIAPAHASDAY